MKWAEMMKLSSKKFLIPLSYAAIFGGMCTLIGTSSNLVVHGLMIENGFNGMHLFELGKLGWIIALTGLIYMAFLGNLLLPGKRIFPRKQSSSSKDYYYNIQLNEGSNLIGQDILNNHISGLNGLEVHSIERSGRIIKPKSGSIRIQRQ